VNRDNSSAKAPSSRRLALIFVGALLLHCLGTWAVPLFDRDEPRFAEASREMIERHDFIVPHFNGDYRFDKPPLIYWCQCVSMAVFGQNEFAVRLPSGVAAACVAVLLYAFGSRAVNEQTGWRGAIIFTTSLLIIVEAKAAVADMVMVAFVTTGFWAGWELARPLNEREKRDGTLWQWMFWISLALGFLAKGPIAWLPLLAPIWCAFRKDGSWRRFGLWWGIPLMLCLMSAWAVPALVATNGEYFRVGIGHHVVDRMLSPMEGHGPTGPGNYLLYLPFYFVLVFVTFLPWSIFLPKLVIRHFKKEGNSALEGYLVLGIAVTFVIFSLMSTKLYHYTMPCFPLMALWLAIRWPGIVRWRKLYAALAIAAALFGATVSLAGAYFVRGNLLPFQFKLAMASVKEQGIDAASAGYDEPTLVWQLHSQVRSLRLGVSEAELRSFMQQPGARLVVLPTDELSEVFPLIPAPWRIMTVKGFAVALGKTVELTILVKPEQKDGADRKMLQY
jgi:4-amino-4-deoxy-L-arabinose transferase-like glycosyltransferase